MRTEEELPIIRAWHEFCAWLIPKISKFPRDLKFVLGQRIETLAITILETLVRAKYTRNRVAMLEQANVDLEVLRFLLRLSHDLKAIPTKGYGDATGKLLDVGEQLGAWRKSQSRRDSP